MLAILLLVIVGLGMAAGYFFSRSWPKLTFALSIVALLVCAVVALFSANCISEENTAFTMHLGMPLTKPHTTFDSLNRWVDPYFLLFTGITVTFLSIGAVAGCAFRKLAG